MMQSAAGTAVEFTMVPSDAFAAEMGLQMGNTSGNKRERENDEEDEASKRARTGPTITPLN